MPVTLSSLYGLYLQTFKSPDVHRLSSNLFYRPIIHLVKFITGETSLHVPFYSLAYGFKVTLISLRQAKSQLSRQWQKGSRRSHRPESEGEVSRALPNSDSPLMTSPHYLKGTKPSKQHHRLRAQHLKQNRAGEISDLSPDSDLGSCYYMCLSNWKDHIVSHVSSW